MTTRPAASPLEADDEAFLRTLKVNPTVRKLLATLDRERAERAKLLDRLRRLHYPPQIGTHYEQGFADCMAAVRKVLGEE